MWSTVTDTTAHLTLTVLFFKEAQSSEHGTQGALGEFRQIYESVNRPCSISGKNREKEVERDEPKLIVAE